MLRIDREIALSGFFEDHFMPLLLERGYNFRNLLQALSDMFFHRQDKVLAHLLWDGVAHLEYKSKKNIGETNAIAQI